MRRGDSGHTKGVVKWGLLIRSAKRRLFAKPLHPGTAVKKSRLKPV
jgi:hypothetical protein